MPVLVIALRLASQAGRRNTTVRRSSEFATTCYNVAAKVLADHITGRDEQAAYHGSRVATKLKVAGVDVAAMGITEPERDDDARRLRGEDRLGQQHHVGQLRRQGWVELGNFAAGQHLDPHAPGSPQFASKGIAEKGMSGVLLGHLSQADALLLVVRAFTDPDVPHVEGAVDPEDAVLFLCRSGVRSHYAAQVAAQAAGVAQLEQAPVVDRPAVDASAAGQRRLTQFGRGFGEHAGRPRFAARGAAARRFAIGKTEQLARFSVGQASVRAETQFQIVSGGRAQFDYGLDLILDGLERVRA